ncbi:uncharacterized protein SETTUDRAFT_166863 [Exserohilum turcica Et28A]|uniref:Uncharacterized protein n=1 Tax=Exserohilum turcicum (strain 28A) TaxID=671987 RepID=R0J216_EXST2|nr:uncharacterized protein SETTUDRAFT_166863 [Exserohilum turcica Et28A]EOA91005.1 hypothetical protein SETTUDRAFT_166863 [Exserohilum turcica Et28A]
MSEASTVYQHAPRVSMPQESACPKSQHAHRRRRDSCDRPLTAAPTRMPTLCPFAP